MSEETSVAKKKRRRVDNTKENGFVLPCSHCQEGIKVSRAAFRAGQKGRCPSCKGPIDLSEFQKKTPVWKSWQFIFILFLVGGTFLGIYYGLLRDRVEFSVRFIPSVAEEESAQWLPGKEHPSASNIIAGDNKGVWKPAPGYVWVSKGKGKMLVKWQPGKPHSYYPNIIAGDDESEWKPAPGYIWISKLIGKVRVKWKPGELHSQHPHVVARSGEGAWKPAPGYVWVSKGEGKMLVKWQPGKSHSKYLHVVARDDEGGWKPAPGYKWLNSKAGDFRIVAKETPSSSSSSSGGAYVQGYSSKVTDWAGNSPRRVTFKAQVKIVVTGSYTVRAGFWKNNSWVSGFFGKSYADRTIRGAAGDVVNVEIECRYARTHFTKAVTNCKVID